MSDKPHCPDCAVIITLAMALATAFVEGAVKREEAMEQGSDDDAPVGPPSLDQQLVTYIWANLPEPTRQEYLARASFLFQVCQASGNAGRVAFLDAVIVGGVDKPMPMVRGGSA